MNNFDDVLTAKEASQVFGYTPEHIRLLCDTGRITSRKSGKIWLISAQSIKQYICKQIEKSKRA
jgi:hypothetical protein